MNFSEQLKSERERLGLTQAGAADVLRLFDIYLVEGALNSLGVALTDYDHQWSNGERTIYEQAIEILRKSAVPISSDGCKDSDLSDSRIFPSPMQWSEWPLHSVRSYMQSVLLVYSPWRVLLLLGRLLASTLVRCSLVCCSYLCWEGRKVSVIMCRGNQLPSNKNQKHEHHRHHRHQQRSSNQQSQ